MKISTQALYDTLIGMLPNEYDRSYDNQIKFLVHTVTQNLQGESGLLMAFKLCQNWMKK